MAYNFEYPYTDPSRYNADWLLNQYKDLAGRVEKVEDEFSTIKVLTREEIEAMIDASAVKLKRELQNYTDKEIIRYNDIIREFIESEIITLRAYVDARDAYVLNTSEEYTRDYVEQEIAVANYMVNPINGQYEDVRDVLQSVIDAFHKHNAITSGEYDAKRLTAGTYDALNISAYNYDYNAKNLLP